MEQNCSWHVNSHLTIQKIPPIYKKPEGSLPCEIWGFHCGEDSSRGPLGCDAVLCCGRIPKFRRSMLTPSSGWSWRQHGIPKRWYPTTKLHGVTTQRTSTWMFITVLTRAYFLCSWCTNYRRMWSHLCTGLLVSSLQKKCLTLFDEVLCEHKMKFCIEYVRITHKISVRTHERKMPIGRNECK